MHTGGTCSGLGGGQESAWRLGLSPTPWHHHSFHGNSKQTGWAQQPQCPGSNALGVGRRVSARAEPRAIPERDGSRCQPTRKAPPGVGQARQMADPQASLPGLPDRGQGHFLFCLPIPPLETAPGPSLSPAAFLAVPPEGPPVTTAIAPFSNPSARAGPRAAPGGPSGEGRVGGGLEHHRLPRGWAWADTTGKAGASWGGSGGSAAGSPG